MRPYALFLAAAIVQACASPDPAPDGSDTDPAATPPADTDLPGAGDDTDGNGDGSTDTDPPADTDDPGAGDTDATAPGDTDTDDGFTGPGDTDDGITDPGDTDSGEPGDTDTGPGDTDSGGPGDTDTDDPGDTDTGPGDTDSGGPGDTDTGPGDTDTDDPGDTDTGPGDTDTDPPPCLADELTWPARTPDTLSLDLASLATAPSWQPLPGDADSLYLDLPDGMNVPLPAHPSLTPVREGTIEAWVWLDEAGVVLTTEPVAASVPGFRLLATELGQLRVEVQTTTTSAFGGLAAASGVGVMPFESWTHLALVISRASDTSTNITLYVNGTLGIIETFDGIIQHPSSARLRLGSSSAPLIGKLGQVRAWRHALPEGAVGGRYNDHAARYARPSVFADPPATAPSFELLPRRCATSAPLPPAYAPAFDEATCVWDPFTWRSRSVTLHEASVVDQRADPVWAPVVDGLGALRASPGRHVELPMPLMITHSAPFTVELWARVPHDFGPAHEGPILSTRTSEAATLGHHLAVNADHGFVYTVETPGGPVELQSGPEALLPGAWQQLALRTAFDDAGLSYALFVDGTPVDDATGPFFFLSPEPNFRLGLPDASFTGDVIFIRAWTAALPDVDLLGQYNTYAAFLERLPVGFGFPSNVQPVNDWWPRQCGEPDVPCATPSPANQLTNTSPAGAAYHATSSTPFAWRGWEDHGVFPEIQHATFASDPVIGSAEATLSIWVRADVDAAASTLLSTEGASSSSTGLRVRLAGGDPFADPDEPVDPSEPLLWRVDIQGAFGSAQLDGGVARLGEWQHLVITLSTDQALYVDGQLTSVASVGSLVSTPSAQLALGAPPAAGPTTPGLLGRMELWSQALDPDEIATLYYAHAPTYAISVPFPDTYAMPLPADALYRTPFCLPP